MHFLRQKLNFLEFSWPWDTCTNKIIMPPLQSLSRAPIIFVLAIKDKEFSWDAQYGCRKLSEYNHKCVIVTRDVQLQSAPALCVTSLMQQGL